MSSGIVVSGGSAEDRSNACAAVEEALHMLATMGMRSTGHVAIDLVHEIPPDGNQHTLGYFDGERNVIILLDYEASVAGSKAHNTWMDRALWRSYLAHELAHAVAFENDTAGRLSLSAHEYIAAVVQLEVLPDAERAAVLEKFPDVKAFERRSEMTDNLYLTYPGLFAVKAYLHYIVPGNGPKFIAQLFAGKE